MIETWDELNGTDPENSHCDEPWTTKIFALQSMVKVLSVMIKKKQPGSEPKNSFFFKKKKKKTAREGTQEDWSVRYKAAIRQNAVLVTYAVTSA